VFLHCGDKTIAIAMDGLEEQWRSPTIPNGPTHGSDGTLQRCITDEYLRPDRLAQFLFGDSAVTGCQQVSKGLECFAPQTDDLASAIHDATLHVEFAVPKGVDHDGALCLVPDREQRANC